MKNKMNQLLKEQRSVHVLYTYKDKESYLKQVVNYVEEGILSGDYVILIENEPIYRMIHKKLSERLTEKQLEYLHYVNNFNFYFSSGSYHPPTILEYFNKTIQPYVENKIFFRSWAHVEWATMEEPLHIIEDMERIGDKIVNQLSFPLVCAYEEARMPNSLLTILLKTHPYVLTEDAFIVSEQYEQKIDV